MENAYNYTKNLLKRGAKAYKSLGQNFLIDDQAIEMIASATIQDEKTPLVEIGPGLGVLTRVLATRVQKVWAVELDKEKIALLTSQLQGLPVEIINMDALELDLKDLWGENKGVLVGNLPYYITSPLLMHFLNQRESLIYMVVMVQKEVADRLIAQPGKKDYGILSVATQIYAQPEKLFEVPPDSFLPAPKVTSAVVRLTLRPYPGLEVEEEKLLRIVKASFSQRRKTLVNSLAGGLKMEKKRVKEILNHAGIEEQRRGETLSIEEFQKITKEFFRNKD
ncbi:MAG: ribosomal RNA small subunit methyltransferase A [Desulfitobacterium sp.]|nr:ribosomal RNA small subunit methyltransferase A [Desulfitobacterium sp.]